MTIRHPGSTQHLIVQRYTATRSALYKRVLVSNNSLARSFYQLRPLTLYNPLVIINTHPLGFDTANKSQWIPAFWGRDKGTPVSESGQCGYMPTLKFKQKGIDYLLGFDTIETMTLKLQVANYGPGQMHATLCQQKRNRFAYSGVQHFSI